MGKQNIKRPLRNGKKLVSFNIPKKPDLSRVLYIGTPLSDRQMNNYLGNISNFLGAICIDELKDLNIDPEMKIFGVIINTEPRGSKTIGHWITMIYDDVEYKEIDYFDSLGENIKKVQIKKFIIRITEEMRPETLLKLKINGVKIQKNRSMECGSYATNFLVDRLINKVSFKEATRFNKTHTNVEKRESKILRTSKFLYI